MNGRVKPIKHPTFKVGMLTDDAERIIKATGRKIIDKPLVIKNEDIGLTVLWFVQDATLVMKRCHFPGPYEVVQIRPRKNKKEIARLVKKFDVMLSQAVIEARKLVEKPK